MRQHVSNNLYDYHKKVEGYSPLPYRDGMGVLTQGVGHTADAAYPIEEGVLWSDEKIFEVWKHDIKEAETLANTWLNAKINQVWFDVTVDLIFNCGKPKTYLALLNEGDLAGARKQIVRWIYDNGIVFIGLVKRRFANYAMTLGDDWLPFVECKSTNRDVTDLNILIKEYGYELIPDSKSKWRLTIIKD